MADMNTVKQKILGAKSQIEGMGAVLKVQYGPAAFALYKAYVDRKGLTEVSEFILGDYLPKAKFDLYMKAFNLSIDEYIKLIVEAGSIPEEVQAAVRAEVAKADMIQIDLIATIESVMKGLRP